MRGEYNEQHVPGEKSLRMQKRDFFNKVVIESNPALEPIGEKLLPVDRGPGHKFSNAKFGADRQVSQWDSMVRR